MKKENNLLISTVIMSVAYVLMLIGASSIDKLFGLFLIALIAYLTGVILSIVQTVKQYKSKSEIEKISLITILSLVSFFPLGLFYLWTKNNWNKIIKIFITVLAPIVAITISIVPITANDSLADVPAAESVVEETIQIPKTTESTTQETTTEQTTTTTTTETTATATTTTTTQATTTTQKETTTQKQSSGRTVYVAPSGKKYHYRKDCAGKNARERDLNDVINSYEPCDKCVH